jgi:hypothetical protein
MTLHRLYGQSRTRLARKILNNRCQPTKWCRPTPFADVILPLIRTSTCTRGGQPATKRAAAFESRVIHEYLGGSYLMSLSPDPAYPRFREIPMRITILAYVMVFAGRGSLWGECTYPSHNLSNKTMKMDHLVQIATYAIVGKNWIERGCSLKWHKKAVTDEQRKCAKAIDQHT